jgi:hypothetical protein
MLEAQTVGSQESPVRNSDDGADRPYRSYDSGFHSPLGRIDGALVAPIVLPGVIPDFFNPVSIPPAHHNVRAMAGIFHEK